MKKLDELFQSVKENAELAGDVLRVRGELRSATNRLARLFRSLGSATYEAHLRGVDMKESDIARICGEIDDERAAMEVLYAELNALNGKVECENCHEVVSVDYDFCPKCGRRIFFTYPDTDADEEKAEAETEAAEAKTDDPSAQA